MSAPYPYSRIEECIWQPEEVGRHMAGLAVDNVNSAATTTYLLSHGWATRQVENIRRRYGSNRMIGDNNNDTDDECDDNILRRALRLAPRLSPCIIPICQTLASQIKEPLNIMLLGSATISIVLGNAADAISIGIALLIVSLVAAVQEYRSEQALEQLNNLVPHTCTVLRDGHVIDNCLAKDLVVGDLVLLATGDRVPADCRVVDSVELTLDESSLTGENHPVQKTGEGINLPTNASLSHQTNIVFAGTLVNAGRGRVVVVAVGADTEFGKVASELNSITSRKSPLQLKIDELSRRLAFFSTCAIVAIAILGCLMGRPFLETLTVAVSLAVAAIPGKICISR